MAINRMERGRRSRAARITRAAEAAERERALGHVLDGDVEPVDREVEVLTFDHRGWTSRGAYTIAAGQDPAVARREIGAAFAVYLSDVRLATRHGETP